MGGGLVSMVTKLGFQNTFVHFDARDIPPSFSTVATLTSVVLYVCHQPDSERKRIDDKTCFIFDIDLLSHLPKLN